MQNVFDGQKCGKPSNYRAFGVLSKKFLSAARACKPLKTLRFSRSKTFNSTRSDPLKRSNPSAFEVFDGVLMWSTKRPFKVWKPLKNLGVSGFEGVEKMYVKGAKAENAVKSRVLSS